MGEKFKRTQVISDYIKKFLRAEMFEEINSITINEEEKVVAVIFKDKDKQIIRCHEDDIFDSSIGVALAIIYHFSGSKRKYHQVIEQKAKVVSKEKKSK